MMKGTSGIVVGREALPSAYQSDPALVQACIEGDEDAWTELVERYGRLVYSIALRAGVSQHDADDVVQNVFTIALRRLPNLRDQTRLSSWLITTTYRECWRLGRRDPIHDDLPDTSVDGESPVAETVIGWERQHQVHEALRRLDERCQTLLTALFLDPAQPSYDLIAERLGMPVGSIGPTRARCFKKLETELLQLGFEPDH